MAIGTIQLTLDTFACNHVSDIVVVRGDYESRFINAFITAKETPILVAPTARVAINAHRPDGQENPFAGTVNEDGSVCVPLAQWMSDVVGRVKCNISVVSNGKKISTTYFYIQVQETPCDSSDIADDDPRKDLITEVIENENRRQLAENERNSKEQERIAAENSRQSAETQRLADEAVRIENESNRVSAEQSRSNAFNGWANDISSLPSFDARISRNSKRITNLEQGLPDDVFVTDSEAAYIKDVPEGVLPYAAISKIGGMTYRNTNLFDINKRLYGDIDANGDLKMVGRVMPFYEYLFKASTQYTLSGYVKNENTTGNVRLSIEYTDGTVDELGLINTSTTYTYVTHTTQANKTIASIYVNFGITGAMYIKGGELMINEGTEALPYEPYFEGLRDAKVTAVKSVGANLLNPNQEITKLSGCSVNAVNGVFNVSITGGDPHFGFSSSTFGLPEGRYYFYHEIENKTNERVDICSTDYSSYRCDRSGNGYFDIVAGRAYIVEIENYVQGTNLKIKLAIYRAERNEFIPYIEPVTLAIPEAVQNKEWYGLGIDENYNNAIDFADKIGDIKVAKDTWNGAEIDITYGSGMFRLVLSNESIQNSSCICNLYNVYTGIHENAPEQSIMIAPISMTTLKNIVYVKDSRFTTEGAFREYLSTNNLSVVYILKTPIKEDLSTYLTDDNLIYVEGGGTLEFVNGYGYDVPNEVFYQLEEVTV